MKSPLQELKFLFMENLIPRGCQISPLRTFDGMYDECKKGRKKNSYFFIGEEKRIQPYRLTTAIRFFWGPQIEIYAHR